MTNKALSVGVMVIAFVCLNANIHPAAAALTAAQEQRYYDLLHSLRCLVCQNQSLADSEAGLAGDLRAEVHKMLEQGLSDAAIYTYMTDRYGDYVLYKPPIKPHTYALWFGPFMLLLLILASLLIVIKKRAKQIPPNEKTQP